MCFRRRNIGQPVYVTELHPRSRLLFFFSGVIKLTGESVFCHEAYPIMATMCTAILIIRAICENWKGTRFPRIYLLSRNSSLSSSVLRLFYLFSSHSKGFELILGGDGLFNSYILACRYKKNHRLDGRSKSFIFFMAKLTVYLEK